LLSPESITDKQLVVEVGASQAMKKKQQAGVNSNSKTELHFKNSKLNEDSEDCHSVTPSAEPDDSSPAS
jgi:hypothetical protein